MTDGRDLNRRNQARSPGTGASQHVINTLHQAIRDGVYKAGDRLIENQLTRDLGVSRSSVREALRRLAADGLIELRHHKGAVVKSLDRREIIEILAVREVLEGFAAGLAAGNIGKEDNRDRTSTLLARIRQIRAGEAQVNFLEDNVSFHRFIVELSGNQTLGQQIQQLQLPELRSKYFEHMQTQDWDRSLSEHQQILEAILERDVPLAEQLMCAHVRRTKKLVEDLPADAIDAEVEQNKTKASKRAISKREALR